MATTTLTMEMFQVLDAIERRGSFAKAAEELNKATSALSYSTQKLEEQLDIVVFQRQGRRSVLTPAGRLLLEEGRKILTASRLLADKARELATGVEPKLRIGLESTYNRPHFFETLSQFLAKHSQIEIDLCECVLSGGWELLEFDQIDLLVGGPGPVPSQKGFRAQPINATPLLPVVASNHAIAKFATDPAALKTALNNVRRVVTHDTSNRNVERNAGLYDGASALYVQTIDQKIAAIQAGLGVGHLPEYAIRDYLSDGSLVALELEAGNPDNFLAWKISNRGKMLKELVAMLDGKR